MGACLPALIRTRFWDAQRPVWIVLRPASILRQILLAKGVWIQGPSRLASCGQGSRQSSCRSLVDQKEAGLMAVFPRMACRAKTISHTKGRLRMVFRWTAFQPRRCGQNTVLRLRSLVATMKILPVSEAGS